MGILYSLSRELEAMMTSPWSFQEARIIPGPTDMYVTGKEKNRPVSLRSISIESSAQC